MVALAELHTPAAPASTASIARPQRRARAWLWTPAIVFAGCLAAFVACQHELAAAIGRVQFERSGVLVVAAPIGASTARFLAVSLGTMVLARRRRHGWWLPAIALVAVPAFVTVDTFVFPALAPAPLGWGWLLSRGEFAAPQPALLWFGAAFDLALAFGPTIALLARRPRTPRVPRRLDRAAFAALGLAGFGVVAYAAVSATRTTGGSTSRELAMLAPAVLFAALLGAGGRWWPLFAAAFAGALVQDGTVMVALVGGSADISRAHALAAMRPAVFAAVLVGAWPLVAAGLRRLSDHPVALLLTCNGLNVADAVLTASALRVHEAAEVNPVIRTIGLPAKIVLVGIASALLARWRPRLLVVPIVVLTGVFIWHLAGIGMRP
ncbi:MAG: hypothetical protein JWL83_3711 [Actinomycetia bacterium]|nr:hypothetical protein [Actinomycetes bacterium]